MFNAFLFLLSSIKFAILKVQILLLYESYILSYFKVSSELLQTMKNKRYKNEMFIRATVLVINTHVTYFQKLKTFFQAMNADK